MNVDDLFRAEYFAAEASNAVFAKSYHRQEFGLAQPRDLTRNRLRFHVDHVCRAYDVADAAAGAFFDLDAFNHAIS